MLKIFYLVIFLLVIIFGCLTLHCNGIKVLENTTKQIINKGPTNQDSIKNSIKSNLKNEDGGESTIKPSGNGLSSTGPVIYPNDDIIENQTEAGDYNNQQDKRSKVQFESSSSSKNQEPYTPLNNNKNVWAVNNNSHSVHSKKYNYPNDLTVTSPEIIQILSGSGGGGGGAGGNKDTTRDGKVIKDFVPSPELKMPLTEEILHQNYMNDRTRIQNHQKPSTQSIQSNRAPSSSSDTFQPLSDTIPDKYTVLTTEPPPIIHQTTTSSYNTNYNQQESIQSKKQQYENLQLHRITTTTASTDSLNSRSNYHDSNQSNHYDSNQSNHYDSNQNTNSHNNDLPIYEKNYPSKHDSYNENTNSDKSSVAAADKYQTSGNQYVRNEVTWPIKDKDYIRVQPQTVSEYVGGGGDGSNSDNNWNNNHHHHQQHPQEQPSQHQHSINVQTQYQIHEEQEKHKEHEYSNHHQYHQNHHNFNPPPNAGPSNIINHHNYQFHQYPIPGDNNQPAGLGQYKHPPVHPYKFEPVKEHDLKWEIGGHHEHGGFLNGIFGGGGYGGGGSGGPRHPIFDALHQHSHNHLPKHYESEVIQSNEDGTITVKGNGPPFHHLPPHHQHHYGEPGPNHHYGEPGPNQHYGEPGPNQHYGEPGPNHYDDHSDDHHYEDNNDGYHHGSIEHSNPGGPGGGKLSKYMYFKKIASIIAGIIPVGLLISALTPNYVMISPNATTINGPVAPFTLIQAKTNRQRFTKKLDEEQQQSQQQQQQPLHPHLGVLSIDGFDNKALNANLNPTSTIISPTISTALPATTATTTTTTDNQIIYGSYDKKKKMNFLKLRKKFSTITTTTTDLPLITKQQKSSAIPSTTTTTTLISIVQPNNSKCIERSICELAAGNKNPQLLKSLLEELQRKYRSEVIENHNRRSTLTLNKIPMSIESWESPLPSSVLASISSIVAATQAAAAAAQVQSEEISAERVDLQTASSSYSLYNQKKKYYNKNDNHNRNDKQSFMSEDDLLRASKGVNCSNYICDELISK